MGARGAGRCWGAQQWGGHVRAAIGQWARKGVLAGALGEAADDGGILLHLQQVAGRAAGVSGLPMVATAHVRALRSRSCSRGKQ